MQPNNIVDFGGGRQALVGFQCPDPRCEWTHDSLYGSFTATTLNSPAPSTVWDLLDPRYLSNRPSCASTNMIRTGQNGLPRGHNLLAYALHARIGGLPPMSESEFPLAQSGVPSPRDRPDVRAFAEATRVIFRYNERTWSDHSLADLLDGEKPAYPAGKILGAIRNVPCDEELLRRWGDIEPVHVRENLMVGLLVTSTIDAVNALKENLSFSVHLHGLYWEELDRSR